MTASRIPVWYPLALIGTWLAFVFAQTGVSPLAATRPALLILALALIVSFATITLIGERHRAGAVALALVLLFVSPNQPSGLVAPACLMVLVLLEARLARWGRSPLSWPLITRVMNAGTTVLSLTVLLAALQSGAAVAAVTDLAREGLRLGSPPDAAAPHEAPDTWIFVLDAYARRDKLAELFGFDNGPFLESLEGEGFDVASQSRSNYLQTQMTLPSMLNMTHLDAFPEIAVIPDGQPAHISAVRRLINESEVASRFRALGYETIAMSSGWEEVSFRAADRFVDTGQLNEFEVHMLRASALGAVVEALDPHLPARQHADRIDATLDAVVSVANERPSRPRFVFVHIGAPHAPVVLDQDGTFVPGPKLDGLYEESEHIASEGVDVFRRRYASEVQYLNRRLLDVVRTIKHRSAQPPVVVLMSDHGSALNYSHKDLAGSDLDERTANFFAAYTPGRPGTFSENVTPVNLFPLLLNTYFGQGLALESDDQYAWTGSSTYNLVKIDPATLGSATIGD